MSSRLSSSLKVADLFCGAGGTSSGLIRSCESLGLSVDLLAINHWDVAISSHTANHPGVRHLCESLDNLDPRKVVPEGRLQLMVASPECTHHSNARGGKPMSDQSRASAWHILRWAEALYIDNLLIENVKEFRDFGPLGLNGRPLKAKKGHLYRQLLSSLRALGYTVEDRVLNAADYGDATCRERLFIQARRGNRRITWPEPTHRPAGPQQALWDVKPWRAAREIIDWTLPSQSIYSRKKPLQPNTLRRIFAGLQKYSGLPFLLGQQTGSAPRDLSQPIPTVCTAGAISLITPFLVPYYTEREGQKIRVLSIEDPLDTITTQNRFGLCQPFLVSYYGTGSPASVEEPLNTITTKDRFGLVSPELVDGGDAVGWLDVHFRMLQPHELAAAMGFPEGYEFKGNRGERVKQIGNAVPVGLAQALTSEILRPYAARLQVAA